MLDKKVIKKAVHKHEAAMHPGKPMTKLKKGGDVKGYAIGGMLANPRAPMVAAPAGGRQAPAYANAPVGRPGMVNPNAIDVKPTPGALSPRGAVTGGPRPGMVNTNAVRPTAAMKKGGAAKNGVPTFNRTPKC